MIVEFQKCSGRHPAAAANSPAALKRVSVSIQAGEQVAVIGPSGAGKTTLLHLAACALQPVDGQLLLDGVNPWLSRARDLQSIRKRLFMAPQVPPLPPRQRVITAVSAGSLPRLGLWASLRNLFYPLNIPAAHEALSRFDLAEKIFERVDRLSGGERQRVGLSRAVVAQADLLLVDEPLSALDPLRAELAMQTITSLASEKHSTLICTLHQVDMALKFFPRILGLRNGELAFDLPTHEVTESVLRDLYAQHLDELNGPAPEKPVLEKVAPTVTMTCR